MRVWYGVVWKVRYLETDCCQTTGEEDDESGSVLAGNLDLLPAAYVKMLPSLQASTQPPQASRFAGMRVLDSGRSPRAAHLRIDLGPITELRRIVAEEQEPNMWRELPSFAFLLDIVLDLNFSIAYYDLRSLPYSSEYASCALGCERYDARVQRPSSICVWKAQYRCMLMLVRMSHSHAVINALDAYKKV